MYKADPHSRVAVLGASPKENRYSFKAVKMLKKHGHIPLPIHPAQHVVDGAVAAKSLEHVDHPVDTVTVYVNAKISDGEYEHIIKLKPNRVIFNPGAENGPLAQKLHQDGIETVEACTLVMLQTGQF